MLGGQSVKVKITLVKWVFLVFFCILIFKANADLEVLQKKLKSQKWLLKRNFFERFNIILTKDIVQKKNGHRYGLVFSISFHSSISRVDADFYKFQKKQNPQNRIWKQTFVKGLILILLNTEYAIRKEEVC